MQCRKIFLLLSLLFSLIIPFRSTAQGVIRENEKGEKIIVYPDGSWRYFNQPQGGRKLPRDPKPDYHARPSRFAHGRRRPPHRQPASPVGQGGVGHRPKPGRTGLQPAHENRDRVSAGPASRIELRESPAHEPAPERRQTHRAGSQTRSRARPTGIISRGRTRRQRKPPPGIQSIPGQPGQPDRAPQGRQPGYRYLLRSNGQWVRVLRRLVLREQPRPKNLRKNV